ncbi:MAG: tetratricopeptide repeat protein [Caulobacterales bacterium]
MTAALDYLGNPVSSADPAVLAAVDDFVSGFLGYEARAADIVRAAAASDAALVNAYAGALFMLMESPKGPPRARGFLMKARAAAGANARERATLDFLEAWTADDIPRALRLSADIAAQWPRDLVMVKLNQYLAFNRGDAPAMLRIALSAAQASPDVAQVHGMVAFASEQCHLMKDAEAAGWRALDMTRREPWAQHALAHVMLTGGRIDEGERFMQGASATWTGLNSFMVTHNWWHLALFRLSQGRDAEVLDVFDRHCWMGDRDYSQDQINAVSLLARLELAGVDVGDRWDDVADHLAARGLDTEQPFLTLQYLYGLARVGRSEAGALLEAIRRRAVEAPPYCRDVWAEGAVPAAEGIVAWLSGDCDLAIGQLERARPRLARIGGSHAQRDLFDQIHLAALLKARHWVSAQQALELRRAFDPDGVPLNRTLARVYEALDLPVHAAEARGRAELTASRTAA